MKKTSISIMGRGYKAIVKLNDKIRLQSMATKNKIKNLIYASQTEDQNMDYKLMLTTFGMIFLAELGDKTQLATFIFAVESKSKLAVFIGSAGALILTSLLAVVFGSAISRIIPANYLKGGAGILFILLGLWILIFQGGK
jgi:putative Ca2+/H+ antiporter (TMEM165/GDT1 family)